MLKRRRWLCAAFLIFYLSNPAGFAAAPRTSIDRVLDSLFAMPEVREVAISPDGERVAWVEAKPSKDRAPSPNSAIYVAEVRSPSQPPRRVTAGSGSEAYSEHDFAWSPDSRKLAFLSDKGNPGQLELYVADVALGQTKKPAVHIELDVGRHKLGKGYPRQLTHLTGFLAAPQWSPDGTVIALLFTENAPRAAGPLEPMTPPTGVIEQQVYEQRLTTVEVATSRTRTLSPADLYVYEYDWSPDGKRFVVTGAPGAGDANWYIAGLYTIVAASGETKSIYKPPLQIAAPCWSPDGKSVAFIGGLMSDEGNTGGDIFVVPATGGEARNLTPSLKASPSWLAWLSADRILFTEWIDGGSGIATLDTAQGKITTLWTGAEFVSTGGWSFGLSLAQDGKTSALVRHSFRQPPEVWAGPLGDWTQVTHLNQEARPEWGEAKSLHWSNDALEIQGWLLYPLDYDAARQYPLVVSVHGGPGSGVKPSWPETFFDLALLSHEGYFVLFPNPRGSFGQGEAFTQANVKNFGYGDFRDILAGVAEVVKTLPVDNRRVGIGGWSYGGFMTMWAVTQTHRFQAAVAGAGIANWQSYYGQNDIDQWMIPFFGASVYDDPAVYRKSSPINFIKNVGTPTLVLVGDRDGECPAPQSFEFWHALRTLGVESQLVVYPHEGHLIGEPEHRRDIMKRTIAWFGRYLQSAQPVGSR